MKLSVRTLGAALLLAPALAAAGGKPAQAQHSDVVLAVYVPPVKLTSRDYNAKYNAWFEPGEALDDSLESVVKEVFPGMVRMDVDVPRDYGLLLDFAPKWDYEAGRLVLELQYNVFAPDGRKLHSSSTTSKVQVKGMDMTSAAYEAARRTMVAAVSDTLATVKPDAATFPANASTAKFNRELLVDRSKPVRTGTGFFINGSGQMLTASHVSRGCVVLEARKDGKAFTVNRHAESDLLDVAVLDSGAPAAFSLPLRSGAKLVLGESVTSVGYPLQGLLADSPNLTRGNVSSASGIKGSYGQFQFSAPIQPGNSGGPVVSDNGELLGMAVGTLNAKSMVDSGLLPQNVNFALDAAVVSKFLRREHVAFEEIQPKGAGEMKVANDAALGATVQLACYE